MHFEVKLLVLLFSDFFKYIIFLFLLSTIFIFYFFHTQHNRISKIKQNKTADTYLTSQGSIKREGEREGQQEHKSLNIYNLSKQFLPIFK